VVAWVAAVPELAFTFFCLLSFYLYVRSEEGSRSNYILSLVSFVFALFSKETALTLPIILVAYDYALNKGPLRSLKGSVKRYIPYLIVTGLYLIARSYGLRNVAPAETVFDLSVFGHVINVFSFFMHYMEKCSLYFSSYYVNP
jgi:hypothetical protein